MKLVRVSFPLPPRCPIPLRSTASTNQSGQSVGQTKFGSYKSPPRALPAMEISSCKKQTLWVELQGYPTRCQDFIRTRHQRKPKSRYTTSREPFQKRDGLVDQQGNPLPTPAPTRYPSLEPYPSCQHPEKRKKEKQIPSGEANVYLPNGIAGAMVRQLDIIMA